MSSRRGHSPKLELKLNLSPTRSNSQDLLEASNSPNSSGVSSCGSTDPADGQTPTSSNMVLVGCPRCLMFVMLPEESPRCPLCKSNILLDFVSGEVLSPNAAKNGR